MQRRRPRPAAAAARRNRSGRRCRKRSAHRSYVLLVLGFFTCGFQLAFITAHLPAYLVDRGLSVTGRRLDDRASSACSTSSARSASAGSATACRSATSCPSIYFTRAVAIALFILLAGHAGLGDRLRRRHRPDLAVHGAADLGPGRADVRHALARDAVRLCVLQPPGRRLPRRLARRHRVRATGSYDLVWWLSIFFGVAVRDDQPADRREAGAAACARACSSWSSTMSALTPMLRAWAGARRPSF